MVLFDVVTWNPDPEIFSLGPLSVRYYGLFFALGFLLGYYIIERMFRREQIPEQWLDKLFIYVVVATVIGARLGHVFFYGWDYYSQNPGEILAIWHGGLASHGGAIGILVAIYFYSKKVTKKSPLWTLDRLVVPVALAAVFIRLGNLMNSEIVGQVTTVSWGFWFQKIDPDQQVVRHPTQIYEALSYLIVFVVLMYMYWKTEAGKRQGLLFGVFLIGIFASRFFIEFVKANQEAFEESMALNMGQILSIPFVLGGIYFVRKAMARKKLN
ncbi:MAG: prolipoprotein diacylglyceryl transferase [Marinilabiliaceae bacterium]